MHCWDVIHSRQNILWITSTACLNDSPMTNPAHSHAIVEAYWGKNSFPLLFNVTVSPYLCWNQVNDYLPDFNEIFFPVSAFVPEWVPMSEKPDDHFNEQVVSLDNIITWGA